MNTPTQPSTRTCAPKWYDVPDEKWFDWRWQLANRLNSVEELGEVIRLTDSEKQALSAKGLFRVDITPYFASLIDPDDPNCPVRKQVIPTARELEKFESQMEDSLAEDRHSPVPGLVHRYPDRVLFLVTTQCASYCRYCTRSRIVGDPGATFKRSEWDAAIDYLKRTPQVRDVLLSGGDPLTLAPKLLEELLARLREIPHIEIIRIGSRVPVFMPMRIDQEFCDMVQKYHPFWMNIHVNHAREITPELRQACDRLSRAGVPLGNQSVLLAGVNDSVNIQRELVHELVKMRVRPYYLYQCDLVEGAGHLRTSVSRGHRDHGRAARPHQRLCRAAVYDRCAGRRRQDSGDAQLRRVASAGQDRAAQLRRLYHHLHRAARLRSARDRCARRAGAQAAGTGTARRAGLAGRRAPDDRAGGLQRDALARSASSIASTPTPASGSRWASAHPIGRC